MGRAPGTGIEMLIVLSFSLRKSLSKTLCAHYQIFFPHSGEMFLKSRPKEFLTWLQYERIDGQT